MKKIECPNCYNKIAVSGGSMELPVYNYQTKEFDMKITIIECPNKNCGQLIGIRQATFRDLEREITIDNKVQY